MFKWMLVVLFFHGKGCKKIALDSAGILKAENLTQRLKRTFSRAVKRSRKVLADADEEDVPKARLTEWLSSPLTESDSNRELLAPASFLESLQPAKNNLLPRRRRAELQPRTHTKNNAWTISTDEKQIKEGDTVRFIIGDKVGEGSSGEVTKVRNPDGHWFALKKIPRIKAIDDAEIRNHRKALKGANGDLTPPESVIQIYEDFRINGDIYIVMELFDAGTLNDHMLQTGQLPAGEARSIFEQVINGLSTCHERGIAHRDLKPENILYNANSRKAKIIDFGLSVDMGGRPKSFHTNTQAGTPNYMAPEILKSSPWYKAPPVDVWAMGVILFDMLCNHFPYEVKKRTNGTMETSYDEIFKDLENNRYTTTCPAMGAMRTAWLLVAQMLIFDAEKRIKVPDIKTHAFLTRTNESTPTDLEQYTPEFRKPTSYDPLMFDIQIRRSVARYRHLAPGALLKILFQADHLFPIKQQVEYLRDEDLGVHMYPGVVEASSAADCTIRLVEGGDEKLVEAPEVAEKLRLAKGTRVEYLASSNFWYRGVVEAIDVAGYTVRLDAIPGEGSFTWKNVDALEAPSRLRLQS